MGIIMQAAIEHEFYLARATPNGYEPFDRSLCYSSVGFATSARIMDDIIAALEQQGIQVEQCMPELGPGQQELSIHHAEALDAADDALLVRETVREVALQHDVIASFAAKPFLDQAGSGAHIHCSLWGAPGSPYARHNLLFEPTGRGGVSQMGFHFIGGVLAHLPALAALTCASPNSYRRLLLHFWSSAYTAYQVLVRYIRVLALDSSYSQQWVRPETKEPRHAIRNTAPHTRATPASMGFFVGCATPDGMCARLRRSAGDRA
jgi:glutamine synthetase